MKIGGRLLLYGSFLLALNLAREPLLRPNESVVRSWLDGKPVMVERGADSAHFVFESIQAPKVVGLKHVSGNIYRNFVRPYHGDGAYAFGYPHGGAVHRYRADIRYTWQVWLSGITRVLVSARIVGPL